MRGTRAVCSSAVPRIRMNMWTRLKVNAADGRLWRRSRMLLRSSRCHTFRATAPQTRGSIHRTRDLGRHPKLATRGDTRPHSKLTAPGTRSCTQLRPHLQSARLYIVRLGTRKVSLHAGHRRAPTGFKICWSTCLAGRPRVGAKPWKSLALVQATLRDLPEEGGRSCTSGSGMSGGSTRAPRRLESERQHRERRATTPAPSDAL